MTFNFKSLLPFSLRHISYQKNRNVNSSGLLISLSFVCSYNFYSSLNVKRQKARVNALTPKSIPKVLLERRFHLNANTTVYPQTQKLQLSLHRISSTD